MKLIKPGYEIMEVMGIYGNFGIGRDALQLIEKAGRVCYKSEEKITQDSCKEFVQKINKLGHESVIEHSAMTVKFICDRGVSHELVRHRLCAFSQESTRYCNYKGGVTFIIPPWVNIEEGIYTGTISEIINNEEDFIWWESMLNAASSYTKLLNKGWSPQQARSVLPNSLKTEIVVTANFREWKHIFNLRCSKAAHPQMREIMIPLLEECKKLIPIIFDEINHD